MNFGELEEQRPGLAHYALLNVKVGELFKRANLLGGQFGDALLGAAELAQQHHLEQPA